MSSDRRVIATHERTKNSEQLLDAALADSVLIERESDPHLQQEKLSLEIKFHVGLLEALERHSRRIGMLVTLVWISLGTGLGILVQLLRQSVLPAALALTLLVLLAIFLTLREIRARRDRKRFEIEVLHKYLTTRQELIASSPPDDAPRDHWSQS